MPNFALEGANSILAEIFSIVFNYFFPPFFLCHVRNPETKNNEQATNSAGRLLQPAGYNAIHARRPPAKQEARSRVCERLPTLYCCGFLLIRTRIINRTLRS